MCVILEFNGSKPEHVSGNILKEAEEGNKDGGGIAWIDGDVVRWEKGIHVTADYVKSLIKKEKIKEPFVVHFRIATHGGVNDELCHPFALSPENDDLATSGSDKEGVMFHNGVWSNYQDFAMKTLLKSGIGYGYHVIHKMRGQVLSKKMDEKAMKEAAKVGTCTVHYGGKSGKGKRIDMEMKSPYYKFKLNIRDTQGKDGYNALQLGFGKKLEKKVFSFIIPAIWFIPDGTTIAKSFILGGDRRLFPQE